MTFRVEMKPVRTLAEAIWHAVEQEYPDLLTDEVHTRTQAILSLCKLWFSELPDLLCVEVDTEAGTCRVLETGDW